MPPTESNTNALDKYVNNCKYSSSSLSNRHRHRCSNIRKHDIDAYNRQNLILKSFIQRYVKLQM